MSLEIIGFPRSNFVRSVRMVAHEKSVTYDYLPEMPQSDVVKSLHPMGQIPAMRHDGFVLFESMAIARYIDDIFDGPSLIPANPQAAATVVQWSSFAQTTVDRLILRQYVVQYMFNKDKDGNVIRDEIDKALKGFPKIFRILNEAVSAGYFGGSEFSMADCFLMPIINAAQNFPEGKEALNSSGHLKKYFDQLSQRPSFSETAP